MGGPIRACVAYCSRLCCMANAPVTEAGVCSWGMAVMAGAGDCPATALLTVSVLLPKLFRLRESMTTSVTSGYRYSQNA